MLHEGLRVARRVWRAMDGSPEAAEGWIRRWRESWTKLRGMRI